MPIKTTTTDERPSTTDDLNEKKRRNKNSSKKRGKKAANSNQVLICVTDCKYEVVREAARARGWKLVDEDHSSDSRKCHVYWIDVPIIVERMQQLERWQRINHFPGMSNVARKGRLAQNLDRMRRHFPQEFGFYPRTWVLPAEWGSFKAEFDNNGKSKRTFILKPDGGCQGRGIFLTQELERVAAMESQVAQVYVRRPLLIDCFKFDLRIYVLVTSVIPLRVYAFRDGLARFCTEEYIRPASDNLDERCMHLTNYAVNKGSDNFVAYEGAAREHLGSKRSLHWLLEWVASQRGRARAGALWRTIGSACVKTLISILPTLHREYLSAFGPDSRGTPVDRKFGNDGGASLTRDGCKTETSPPKSRKNLCRREEGVIGSSQGQTSAVGSDESYGAKHHGSVSSTQQETETARVKGLVGDRSARVNCSYSPDGGGNSASVGARGGEHGAVDGSRCVEILGFDFMVDEALKPWLIEVNHLPSFATDSPLDSRIKSQIVSSALSVLRAKAEDKKCYEESTRRNARNRLYSFDDQTAHYLAKELERKEAEAIVAKKRRKVEAIYVRFAPHKLGKVDGLLARYAGNEDKLLRLMHRKYVDAARGKEHGATPPCDRVGEAHSSALSQESDAAVAESPSAVDEVVLDPVQQRLGRSAAKVPTESKTTKCCTGRSESQPPARRPNSGNTTDTSGKRGCWSKGGLRVVSPTLLSSTPPTAPQHDTEELSREEDILTGWERLHPPVGARCRSPRLSSPSETTDGDEKNHKEKTRASQTTGENHSALENAKDKDDLDCAGTDARESGGQAARGRTRKKPPATAEVLIQRAFEEDRKMRMRLKYPLQQRRGSVMDPQPGASLPVLAQPAASSAQNRAEAAVSAPEQRKKAQRLMEGFSSGCKRSASAPTADGPEVKSQLPANLQVAVVRAKEWRKRMDEESARRASRSVALKVRTFDFVVPEENGIARGRQAKDASFEGSRAGVNFGSRAM